MSKNEKKLQNGSGQVSGVSEDVESLELPLINLPGAHPCRDCGDCCSYIATEIDDPTTFADYENIHWYLTHKNISVYIDDENDWFIEFRSECEHITESKTCGIYEERPKICEEFSWHECEKSSEERAWKYYFNTYADLIDWMQKKRPKALDTYNKRRKKMLVKRAEASKEESTQKLASDLSRPQQQA